jgi:hypothetical protein
MALVQGIYDLGKPGREDVKLVMLAANSRARFEPDFGPLVQAIRFGLLAPGH